MERLRHELSEKTLRRHLQDLISAGRLRAAPVCGGQQMAVTPEPGQLTAAPPITFPNNPERPRPAPRPQGTVPMRMRVDTVRKTLTEAATRDGKRPRPAPRRAAVLALLNEQPMTVADIASALKTTHATCLEHVAALRQSGLVVRYAIVRAASGCRTTLWVSTRLRLTLPAPPPCPPPLPRRRNRSVTGDETALERAVENG